MIVSVDPNCPIKPIIQPGFSCIISALSHSPYFLRRIPNAQKNPRLGGAIYFLRAGLGRLRRIRDDYELHIRTNGGLGSCPWYEEAIDLAVLFHCAPEDPFEKWDKVWLNRARVILQGRRAAAIDSSKKRIDD